MADTPVNWPFTPSPLAIDIVGAQGCHLHTRDGRKILDAAGGAMVVNIGHGRREPGEAMARASSAVSYVIPPFVTPQRMQLAERLQRDWLPPGFTRLHLSSGGSEAVETAVKLARQYHFAKGNAGRWKVIGRDLSYHGATVATLEIGGHAARRAPVAAMARETPKAPPHYCLRCPLGRTYPTCDVACADEVEAIILREGADTVAGFIAEPVVGSSGGALEPPPGYWRKLRAICDRHDVVLIADEVVTGFGRTGVRFASEGEGALPDIIATAKGMSGGYAPIGGTFATERIAEPLQRTGDAPMFYTFSAHPAACAAADVVLDILSKEDLMARARVMGDRLGARLQRLKQHPNVAEVRGRGLLRAIEIVRDRETLERFPAEADITMKVLNGGLAENVYFYPGGTGAQRDVIVLAPPFIVTDAEIETMCAVLERAIDRAVEQA
ncbi:aspartate aminotransferase family protein [Vineibacter terrae]|uniref:aminotransferase family protein n=1 Tax=Vineibacter terrae TaxID=2586908 RepID=UPI002E37CE04|nr:aminotransferase class III-fold pyridoxal phosphate-dependent enzyme [Vineibacter terrae]HEX2885284.1 aminotransferase class III-fold pyridoxal phosphate-dependent enzyme [Vineibacter terrae]